MKKILQNTKINEKISIKGKTPESMVLFRRRNSSYVSTAIQIKNTDF